MQDDRLAAVHDLVSDRKIIDVSEGVRVNGRISEGDRVAIGDAVVELEARDGVRYFSGLRP